MFFTCPTYYSLLPSEMSSPSTPGDDRKPPPLPLPPPKTTMSAGHVSTNIEQQTDVSTTIPSSVVAPKFGFVQGNIPVLGGPPDTGFTRSLSVVPASPYCMRDPNPRYAELSYQRRVESLNPKFSPTGNDYRVAELADATFNHCILHGIDTPFYLLDPTDDSRMLNVFHYHGKFTYNEVKEHLNKMVDTGVFDQYMITSLSDSAAFLLNSMDLAFQRVLRSSLMSDEVRYGPLVWMKIVEEVVPNTFRRMDDLEKLFKGRSVLTTPGENVNVWAQEQLETLLEMDANDQLPRDHLLILAEQLTSCSVEAFRLQWHVRYDKIADFVRQTAGKSKAVAEKVDSKMNYRSILQTAKELYATLKSNWGPANNKVNANVANAAALKSLKAEIKSLKAKFGDSTDAKTPSSAPKDKKTGNSASDKSSSNSGGGDGNKKGDGSTETRWNRIAPKDGEPTTITKYGKKFHWCAKCKRWTQTHGTDQHKSKEEAPPAGKSAPPSANFANAGSAPLMAGWGSDSDSE